METKEILRGKRVYFDVGIFIEMLEGFKSSLLTDLKDLISKGEIEVVTSSSVYTEIIPICAPNEDRAVDFVRTFNPLRTDITELMGVYEEVDQMPLVRTTHVLTAIKTNCDVFFTDDPEIKVPNNIELVLFPDCKNTLDRKNKFFNKDKEMVLQCG